MRKSKNLLSFIFLLLLTASAYSQDWRLECIDSTMGPAHHHRMILDRQNLPHIFFYNADNRHLMQFYKSDTGWNLVDYPIQFVPEGLDIDSWDNFHLSQGGANVVYYMFTNQETTYIDTIYVGNIPILFSKIRIDNNGVPHIIAVSYDTGDVFHITREDSIWDVEQVLTFFPYLAGVSTKIDSSNTIHVALTGNIPVAVGYANDDPDWSYSVLVNEGAYGNVKIDLGLGQRPALTYNFYYPEGELYQALLEFNGSSWDTTYFDTSFSSTGALPFAYDPDNRPHLILYKGGEPPENRAMIHTYRMDNSWSYDTVAVGPFLPQDLSADGESHLHLHFIGVDHRGFYYGIKDLSTGIEDYPVPINKDFDVLNSYPNPFNAATTIEYYLPKSADISLSIYNLLGQRVTTLFEGAQQAGSHTITWDASDFRSGVYFVRMEAGNYTENIKIVLLK